MINQLSDSLLLEKIKTLVKAEREATYEVLLHLREVERRMLYAQLGYSSLFAYAVQELKYSEDESARRISAMRMLREVPSLEAPIKSGSLSLSNLGQARSYFKAQGIKNTEMKKEILEKLENKSRREGENILARLPSSVGGAGANQIAKNQENHTMTITSELKQKLEMVRSFLNLGAEISYDELLHKMAEALFKSKSPAPARVDSRQDDTTSSRYIPKSVKSAVYIRERGRCSYISKLTGKQCGEIKNLHYEHCKPYALGGENKLENITLLCRAHNSLRAVESFGAEKMQKYLPSLRL